MRKNSGATIAELVLVIAMVAIIGVITITTLVGRKSKVELETTTKQIVALLRDAQSRARAQASGVAWGVHFENSTSTAPFYALFRSSYLVANRVGYYRLPTTVGYATSSLAQGASRDVVFSQLNGTASPASIQIYLINSPTQFSTIQIGSSGAVSY